VVSPSPSGAGSDTWDAEQYLKFSAERDQPFRDLLALLRPVDRPHIVDLGCGDGHQTAHAHERLGAVETVGIDRSPAMLAAAAEHATDGLRFEPGDIGALEPGPCGQYDVVLSNAALHWLPDHESVLARWHTLVRPGGQLAVQMPANADHGSHRVLAEVVDELALDPAPEPDPVAVNVLPVEAYADILDRLGVAAQHVRLQVYAHHLDSTSAVVEWVKGTTLTRIRKVTDDDGYERFVTRYRERLLEALGDRAPYTYLFKRILLWAAVE
jgi:trans-aconitate 2-methyltransferase